MTESQVRAAVEMACLLMNGEPLDASYDTYHIDKVSARDDGSLDVKCHTPWLSKNAKRPLFKAFVVAACGMSGLTATPQFEHESMVTFWVKANG